MYYSEEDLQRIAEEYATIGEKHERVMTAYIGRVFAEAKAQEYATHGFARRWETLYRCIENTFRLLPPESPEPPSREDRFDATVNLQAFIFNAFGSVDNLAWVLVSERHITKPNGRPLPLTRIGFDEGCVEVWQSLSEPLQDYLEEIKDWRDHLRGYRHALAHRIPLYVPPFIISEEDAQTYNDLETQKTEAAKRRDVDAYKKLNAEQNALGTFRPWMMHSFSEEAKPIVVHPQLLADFMTIEQLAEYVLAEIDGCSVLGW